MTEMSNTVFGDFSDRFEMGGLVLCECEARYWKRCECGKANRCGACGAVHVVLPHLQGCPGVTLLAFAATDGDA